MLYSFAMPAGRFGQERTGQQQQAAQGEKDEKNIVRFTAFLYPAAAGCCGKVSRRKPAMTGCSVPTSAYSSSRTDRRSIPLKQFSRLTLRTAGLPVLRNSDWAMI